MESKTETNLLEEGIPGLSLPGASEKDVLLQGKAGFEPKLAADEIAPQKDASKLQGLQAVVQGKASTQAVNGMNFAMGFAWSAALLAIITPHHVHADEDPRHTKLKVLWAATGVCFVFVITVKFALIKLVKDWQSKANQATLEQDWATAIRFRSKEMSLTTIVKWGVGTIVADMINQAVNATLPYHWQWHLLWFITSLLVNLTVVVVIRQCLKAQGFDDTVLPVADGQQVQETSVTKADGSFAQVSADVWFTTGSYISALAFLSTVEMGFQVDPKLSRTTDVVMLYIFSTVAVGIAGIILAILQNAETRDAQGGERNATVGLYVRKFISKTFSMCAATIVFLLLYVSIVELQFKIQPGDETQSVYDPLPVWSAVILMACSFIMSLTIGWSIERSLKTIAAGLARVDRQAIPGVADDAILATLQSVAQTTQSSYTTAFAWLVGIAIHKFFTAIWTEVYGAGSGHADWVMSSSIYAVVVTVLAVVISICVPPPPKEV